MAKVKVGDRVPSVTLYENTPANGVNLDELLKGKKVVIFAVPGAFTPGCSRTHLPGYIRDYDLLKKKGVDEIVCVSVNDPFVMHAWGEVNQVGNKIRMLADTTAELTKALGVELDATKGLGNIRSKRYSMIVEDGVIKAFNLEPDGGGLTCSLSNELLSLL
eukprot:TRINITY_DN2127_c0_g1_i1.p1 TRINITY_DN2127_c0_g1~~TRINITY_DN2127_c0_g1_i1.p1  ORF type:complete len:184 (-),score=49.97 TRINITY_DN2127_c0_g1_i1:42-524(-)